MKCVILQPSYIPWRGYFHQIYKADVFVFYDDVQYDKGGWRNRNRIKTPHGTQWLTIPVNNGGTISRGLPINRIEVCWDQPWRKKHLATLKQVYGRAPYFEPYVQIMESMSSSRQELLSDVTIELTINLANALGIKHTRFVRSSTLGLNGSKTDRLISILSSLGATNYLSGPSARAYLEEEKFHAAGIEVEYMSYDYPEYEQLYPPFDPHVTILDLMFMTGPKAAEYIW